MNRSLELPLVMREAMKHPIGVSNETGSIHRGLLVVLIVVVTLGLSIGWTSHAPGETGLDAQNGIKLAVWLGLLLLAAARWRVLLPYLFQPTGILLTLLASLTLLSAFWSPVPLYTGACAIGFSAYTVMGGMVARELTVDTVLSTLLWSLFAFVVLGFLAMPLFPEWTWAPPSVDENVYRFHGLAVNPNGLGHHAALYMVIAIGCFTRQLMGRFPLGLHLAIGSAAVLLSGDRTIMVALMATLGLVTMRSSILARWVGLGVAGLAVATLMFYAAGQRLGLQDSLGMISRTGSIDEIMTLTGRTDIWAAAFDRFLERPVFGWGFNGTEDVMTGSMPKGFYGTAVNAHNMFLQLALSLGVVGLIPGVMLATVFGYAYFKHPTPYRDLVFGLIFINGFAEADFFATPVLTGFLFFWMLLSPSQAWPRLPVREF